MNAQIHAKYIFQRKAVIPMNERMSAWVNIIVACAPVLVALVGIIPTIINNRKKTQASLNEMMEELKKDSKETNEKVDKIGKQLEDHIKENEDDNAKQARARILSFYDEICENKKHSESHFEDILDDIDYYENYTESHKDFKNSRGKAAMNYIRSTYSKVKETGGFLTHSNDT